MPKLSVIIPTYNRAALLPRVVDSVRRAGTDLEIIVVDNASSDETPAVCQQLPGIRYYRLPRNTGETGGRNAGIKASLAEYVAFLDDDDLRLPGSLDAQVQVLMAHPQVALIYGRVLLGDAQNCTPTGDSYPESCPTGDVFWNLLEDNFIPMPSVVAKRQQLIDVGLFDERLRSVGDWDLWLRVAERFELAAVTEPVAIYRRWSLRSRQMSSDRASIYGSAAAVQAIALGRARAMTVPEATRREIRQRYLNRLSDALMYEAFEALAEGRKRPACANVWAALRLQPQRIANSRRWRGVFGNKLRNTFRGVDEAGRT